MKQLFDTTYPAVSGSRFSTSSHPLFQSCMLWPPNHSCVSTLGVYDLPFLCSRAMLL